LWVMKFWNSRNLRWVHTSPRTQRRGYEDEYQYSRFR
jgi:hypothetical protein